jgi:5-methylcytosine-specific restriction endonuclease McrA
MARVLVLNATYEPINVCTLRRAAVLLLKEKAELLEQREGAALHSERMTMERPDVIRLVNYVRIPREAHRRKITRRAVLARDSWTCQYCGSTKPGLTVDHVIPRSRGGKSVWENIVAACAACNRRKGNRLPREIQMHPATTPKAPPPTVFIQVAAPICGLLIGWLELQQDQSQPSRRNVGRCTPSRARKKTSQRREEKRGFGGHGNRGVVAK